MLVLFREYTSSPKKRLFEEGIKLVLGLIVYSHCTRKGPGHGPTRKLVTNGNVHTGPRQGQGTGSIASCCVSSIPCTDSCPGPVQCEYTMTGSSLL